MKKSKIILPAIALLAVSGIASVTGTVAWFTAANSAKFSTGIISAVNVDSTLNVDLLNNTELRNGTINNTDKIFTPSGVLTNASYDLDNKTTWLANEAKDPESGTAVAEKGYRQVSTTGTAGVTNDTPAKNIYYSYQWQAEFSCPASAASDYDLFFDLQSVVTSTDADLEPAFRIALDSDDSDAKNLLWNPQFSSTTKCEYVSAGAVADYATNDAWEVVKTGSKATTAMQATSARNSKNYGYLGTLSGAGAKITVTFTVWCEGQDGACINDNAGGNIAANFAFYAINSAEYAA